MKILAHIEVFAKKRNTSICLSTYLKIINQIYKSSPKYEI